MEKCIVITTINDKTEAIRKFESYPEWDIIIVGDKKSKPINSTGNTTFLSVESQANLGFSISPLLPYNHYTRKNIGYLYALQNGAKIIYDTDDDNIPYPFWKSRDFHCFNKILTDKKFLNIYRYFTSVYVWPRGFPLDELLNQNENILTDNHEHNQIGVWQGLADIEPDVDAIYRLVYGSNIEFKRKPDVYLQKGVYCPFNSQNTFWRNDTLILAYLPATVSFRFTDILRGYIAQRVLWEKDLHLGFTEATVYQQRNKHILMEDFKDEIECYLNTKEIIRLLDGIKLTGNISNDLLNIYQELVNKGFINREELPILESWLSDVYKIQKG